LVLKQTSTAGFGHINIRCHAELVAANRASSVAAGLVAFVVVAVGFLVASGLWLAYRLHWEKTRWAAFVEDTATPVCAAVQPTSQQLRWRPVIAADMTSRSYCFGAA
jgi:hypothetical protein